MSDAEFQNWLNSADLNSPVNFCGEKFILNVSDAGAELGAYFLERYTKEQLEAGLQMGFASATVYKAGLAIDSKSNSLLLTRWLPGVKSWQAAAKEFDEIWAQLEAWRDAFEPNADRRVAAVPMSRAEYRMRSMLQSKRS